MWSFFFLKHLVTVVALISETDVFTKSSEPQQTLNWFFLWKKKNYYLIKYKYRLGTLCTRDVGLYHWSRREDQDTDKNMLHSHQSSPAASTALPWCRWPPWRNRWWRRRCSESQKWAVWGKRRSAARRPSLWWRERRKIRENLKPFLNLKQLPQLCNDPLQSSIMWSGWTVGLFSLFVFFYHSIKKLKYRDLESNCIYML